MEIEKLTVTPEQIRAFQRATLMDDDFMRAFFRGNDSAVQKVLRIIMDKPDLVVMSVSIQEELPGFGDSHGVRFDVYAVDSDGTQYDIEIQNRPDGATPQRADFNSAMMTVRTLKAGENYSALAERRRVVIFITATDVLKGKRPIYTIERVIRETGQPFNDGTKIIYINTSYKDTNTALGRMIHDFRCKDPKEWYDSELAIKAAELKGDDGTVKELEELKARAWEIGKADGETDMQQSIALSLIRRGKDALEEIAELCHMTLEQVQNLAATVKP